MPKKGPNAEDYLKQLLKNSRELPTTVKVTFGELFSESFMRKYTEFSSLPELLSAGGFGEDVLDSLPNAAFDKHVATHSQFSDWYAMYSRARNDYLDKRLGI